MKIPVYPESRALNMSDKPLLDRIFEDLQPRVSELTFAGLYLFRAAHDYQVTMVGSSMVILGKGYDGTRYFLPPFNGNIASALSTLFNDNRVLYGADRQFAEVYFLSDSIIISEDRDSFDYLYLREELAILPGNRFHKKKNRINYFTSRHQYEVMNYTDRHCNECLELLNVWLLAVRDKSNISLDREVSATREALHNASELGMEGIVVMVEGVVAAFALGEKLNRNTAVCHFEKADPFKEGLTQLVNREFARLLFTDCRFINREQDLGEAGLRNAKLSYHPTELIEKYRAIRIQS
jgi:hypothetical protein